MTPELALAAGEQVVGSILGEAAAKRHKKAASALNAEADSKRVPLEDIETRGYLNELERKRRAIGTGYAYQDANAKLGQDEALAEQNILNASGGAGGAAIAGITSAQRAAGAGRARIAQQGEQAGLAYTQLYGNLLDSVSQRKADLQLNEYERLRAQAEGELQAGEEAQMGAQSQMVGGLTSLLGNADTSGISIPNGRRRKPILGGDSIDSGITDYSISGLRKQGITY